MGPAGLAKQTRQKGDTMRPLHKLKFAKRHSDVLDVFLDVLDACRRATYLPSRYPGVELPSSKINQTLGDSHHPASHVVFSQKRPSWKGSCALSWSGVGRYLIEPVPREHGLRKTFHYIHRSCRL